MAADTQYQPVPFIYQCRGLIARDILDRAPEGTFLNLMNVQVREESSLSSRYGTTIVNRDPIGTGTTNYPFTSNVTSLARLVYQGSSYRYACLENGQFYRRVGDGQGAYTQLTLPTSQITGSPTTLSGNAFQSTIQSCYETSQPYLFVYDQDASIKDTGVGNPQLTGIDPPKYTANSLPFSPLLTLIDNFATGNSYSTSGFDEAWAYSSITTIDGTYSSTPTDFPQFIISGTTIAGGSANYSQSTLGGGSQNVVISGFSSTPVDPTSTVTMSFTLDGNVVFSGSGGAAEGQISLFYSIDSGATWTLVGADPSIEEFTAQTYDFPTQNLVINVTGVSNLDTIQFQLWAFANVFTVGLSASTTATLGAITASVPDAGVFGEVCNGILSVLNTNATIQIPIISIENTYNVNSFLVTCASAHGRSPDDMIAIYGSSNDLLDGFYEVLSVPSPTTFTISVLTTQYAFTVISATGGYVMGGAAAPSTCVLADEYSTPYPAQFSAWGFYQSVPDSTTSFPVGNWSGSVDVNSTATVGNTIDLDLSINNQVTDDDLIVLTLNVGSPANIQNIRLQFDVNGSNYTSSYYYANVSPAYYQGNIENTVTAYTATENQILAETLGVVTGQPISTTTAQLQPSNFSTGSGAWVAVYIPRGNFLPVGSAGQSGLDWTNVTGWQVVIETQETAITGDGSSTVAMNGLYLQWGYGPSSFGGVGYNYRYTFYNANTGTESSPSPEQKFNENFGYLASLDQPIYLRQAVSVSGYYSLDSQVTHVRFYRQGGDITANWVQIDQITNIVPSAGNTGQFFYKDVISDAFIQQAPPLELDNDPPVTSSLVTPIQTTLSAATASPGNSIYSTFNPQTITVSDNMAVFVPTQEVEIGSANNIEVVTVVAGGTGTFTAIVRLQHNAGEPVSVQSVPRQPCGICAFAYERIWLAGDENNPGYLYYSKGGKPENFGVEDYIIVSSPSDPINAVINWRGTLYVGTQSTWYIIQGGAQPIAQPTGSIHGIVARQGWCQTEGAIWYASADGLREFRGSEGAYMSLPVEWIFRSNPLTPLPLLEQSAASETVLCYYNNEVYVSYVSQQAAMRYRLIYDTVYKRYRIDSLPMTAMLWESDTNTFLGAYPLSSGNNYIVEDQQYTQDYDDGGWSGSSLVQTEIPLTIQIPYQDLNKPHFPKQWNVIECDTNTQSQTMNTQLVFDDGSTVVTLPAFESTERQKVQLPVNGGLGQQGYRMSLIHTINVTTAPILYQENVYAAELAAFRYSFDTYWILGGSDEFKLVKEAYFDYTSTMDLEFSLYADNSTVQYYDFTLPAEPNRATIRVRFPAIKLRQFRMVANAAALSGDTGYQMWRAPQLRWKACRDGSGFQLIDLVT